MKKKPKIFFVIILLAFLASLLGLIIYIYTKSSKTDINQDNEITENDNPNKPNKPDKPDKPIDKSDFVKSNTTINFKLEQKMYLLNFTNGVSFNINEFKYYFINEFNKLGPKTNKINLIFNYDSLENTKKIDVSYKGNNKTYFWYFKLN